MGSEPQGDTDRPHAVGRAAPVPPSRRRRRPPLWTRLVIVGGALVAVASLATVVVPRLLIRWAVGDVVEHIDVPDELKATDINGPINMLLLGTDSGSAGAVAGDPDHSGFNADSIVLVHIPASHDQVYMVSIPRDTYVGIPSRNSPASDCRAASHNKINAAFGYGAYDDSGKQTVDDPTARGRGVVLMMRTISCLVGGGLKFNGSAMVNFDGFDKVVEAVGSVHMCIDENVWSIHYAADGTPRDFYGHWNKSASNRALRKHYTQGTCPDLQPWEALDYARQRYDLQFGDDPDSGDSDYGRQRHQQQLLKAIMEKIASPSTLTNVGTIRRLRNAAGGALSLNLNDTQVEDFVYTLKDLRASDVITIKTYGGKFNSVPCTIGGTELSCEGFGSDLKKLLEAVRDDTVFDFLVAHPDWVAQDS